MGEFLLVGGAIMIARPTLATRSCLLQGQGRSHDRRSQYFFGVSEAVSGKWCGEAAPFPAWSINDMSEGLASMAHSTMNLLRTS